MTLSNLLKCWMMVFFWEKYWIIVKRLFLCKSGTSFIAEMGKSSSKSSIEQGTYCTTKTLSCSKWTAMWFLKALKMSGQTINLFQPLYGYETLRLSFLCFRVSEHFPSTWVIALLFAYNFMFTGQRLCSGSNFFKFVKGIALHWALVSILYETGISFDGKVTDQSKFSMLIWLIYAEFSILIVSVKIL